MSHLDPTLTLCVLADRPHALRLFLSSLVVQTRHDFEVIVLDQFEAKAGAYCTVADVCDEFFGSNGGGPLQGFATRVKVPRTGDWGQTAKFEACRDRAHSLCVGFPNDDAYYAPVYVERMLQAIEGGYDIAACDWIFDQQGYLSYTPKPQTGWIDVGGFVVRRQLVVDDGWIDRTHEGDGRLVERLVARGARFAAVRGHYYVKN